MFERDHLTEDTATKSTSDLPGTTIHLYAIVKLPCMIQGGHLEVGGEESSDKKKGAIHSRRPEMDPTVTRGCLVMICRFSYCSLMIGAG